ncbi:MULTISPECIES: SCO family protein [unclassified Sulfitobacter]|uniref:SCO family protein n=1 Tax=unclassified Sulfitobacter TaxID=196795 RepID=UPI0015948B68|nr:SCO family protein [Sulfitobacter sp. HGT1]MBQ0805413.1 SCO family protein [Sulfitobacter sp.]
MTRIIAICAAVVALGFMALTLYLGTGGDSDDKYAQCKNSAVAGDSDLGGPFELVNSAGQTVTDTDVITEPSLIYFGYTFCPDVCPLDVARNATAIDILEERGMSVTPVFISIDPARDTPETVGEFADNMHPKMIGLTGSAEQVAAASAAYRTYYKAHEAKDEFYLVDHSTFSYLVMPGEGFVDFFRRDVSPDQMADKIGCFIENQ